MSVWSRARDYLWGDKTDERAPQVVSDDRAHHAVIERRSLPVPARRVDRTLHQRSPSHERQRQHERGGYAR